MPSTIEDPLSFLLNLLPTKLPRSSRTVTPWTLRWPTICSILFELDYLYNHIDTCTKPPHGQLPTRKSFFFITCKLNYIKLRKQPGCLV